MPLKVCSPYWFCLGLAALPLFSVSSVSSVQASAVKPEERASDLVSMDSALLATEPSSEPTVMPIVPTAILVEETRQIAQTPLPPTPSSDIIPRPPDSPSNQPIQPQQPAEPLPSLDDLLKPVPGQIPIEEGADVPQTITVSQFVVTGSTVFSQQQFDEKLKDFVGKPITLTDLFQARTVVTQMYLDQGYVTSGAYIPPQKLQAGVVEIRVIEGALEDIKVTGTRRLKPNYVRSRLGIAAQPPLNRDRLLEALQLLQLDPLIGTISAELSAGTRPGVSLLEVKVTEAKTFGAQFLLDNGRSPSVGTDRRQIQVNEANLLGFGDGISASYTNTDGSDSFDLSYSFPVNPRNGRLSFYFSSSNSDVIEAPFDVLEIESKSRTYELTFRQPIKQTLAEDLALGITFSRRESKATLLDGEIPFPSAGSDEEGKTRLSVLRFFQEWTRRSSQQVFALRSQLSLGLDVFDATDIDFEPDSRFLAWRGQAQYVRLLAPDTLLLLRGDVQLAGGPIASLEQFSLGGIESVRGYRQDLLLADSGIFASAEARIPVLRIPEWQALLQVTPFVDFGTGWNRGDRDNASPNELFSVGMGLRLQVSDKLTARFEWGIPLIDDNSEGNTLQEDGLYFSVIYNPF
jgi:hemolysin activation/secretion protein